jgi:hypothetical protein
MTAKQKAEELLANFGDIEHLGVIGDYTGNWEWSSSLWRQQTKQAALICVDELEKIEGETLGYKTHYSSEWWQEVKQEIENICN